MLYRVIFLFSFFLFLSCENHKKSNSLSKPFFKDSIVFYHNKSIDESSSLYERINAANKAFSFTIESDSFFSKVLYQKSFIHFYLKEYDSLFYYSNSMFDKNESYKNFKYIANQHHLLAYYYDEISNKSDKAFFHYNLSKDYFQKLGDSSRVGRRLTSMAIIQKNKNDFFGSKETLTEALVYLDSNVDSKFIASTYNALATSHRKLFNYEDAINFYNKAIKIALSNKDKLSYQNNLAATYIDNEQYKKAIAILESISKDSLTQNSNQKYARVIDNLAYAKWLSGLNQTEDQFIKALWIRKKEKDQRGQIASYTHLGEFYTRKNPPKAKAYFDSVIQLSKKLKIPRAEKDALKFLMKIDTKNVFIRDRYVTLNDSLYQQELKVKTQFAKYKYDDKLKQESILRLEKEKAEKEVEIAEEKTRKIMSYFGIALLLLGIGFIVYSSRQRNKRLKQKNKTDKLAATFETEAQLARRVHDDFGAKLNHSMFLVKNNTAKMIVLDFLESLYNQSRNFSREINEVDTGKNYKEELFQMLQNYTLEHKLYTIGAKEIDWISVNALSKTVLYKVLRELMINMSKYSQATVVTITFKNMSGSLKVDYSDDGVGASKKELNFKNGLRITEKRIKAISGTIIFDSEKGKGFKAEIKIPN